MMYLETIENGSKSLVDLKDNYRVVIYNHVTSSRSNYKFLYTNNFEELVLKAFNCKNYDKYVPIPTPNAQDKKAKVKKPTPPPVETKVEVKEIVKSVADPVEDKQEDPKESK